VHTVWTSTLATDLNVHMQATAVLERISRDRPIPASIMATWTSSIDMRQQLQMPFLWMRLYAHVLHNMALHELNEDNRCSSIPLVSSMETSTDAALHTSTIANIVVSPSSSSTEPSSSLSLLLKLLSRHIYDGHDDDNDTGGARRGKHRLWHCVLHLLDGASRRYPNVVPAAIVPHLYAFATTQHRPLFLREVDLDRLWVTLSHLALYQPLDLTNDVSLFQNINLHEGPTPRRFLAMAVVWLRSHHALHSWTDLPPWPLPPISTAPWLRYELLREAILHGHFGLASALLPSLLAACTSER
jgi:hypothetical protein